MTEVTAKEEGRVSQWNTTLEKRKHMRQPEGGKHQSGSSALLRREEETT